MKIVSFNTSNCTQEKLDKVFSQNADLYVIPECSCSRDIKIPEGYEMFWDGIEYKYNNASLSKGIGMIARKDIAKSLDWYDSDLKYAIPLMVGDLLDVGFWPTKQKDKKESYVEIAKRIIDKYEPYIRSNRTIIIGDFNLYHSERKKNSDAELFSINKHLNSLGLFSQHHKRSGEDFGKETIATYYHNFNEEKKFFLDYAYANFEVESYKIADWDKKMSDHCMQLLEV